MDAAREQEDEIRRERAGMFTGVDGVDYSGGKSREEKKKEARENERQRLWRVLREKKKKKTKKKDKKKSGIKKSTYQDETHTQ